MQRGEGYEGKETKNIRKWRGSRFGRGGGGEKERVGYTERERTERDELSWMLVIVKLYQISPSELPCDQCTLLCISRTTSI